MISRFNYKLTGHKRSYQAAKIRKQELKDQGYRVKIRKAIDGGFDLFIKDVLRLDIQEKHGRGGRLLCH